MEDKRDRHHRRSLRLKAYDYAQAGAYFLTICVRNHSCLFGEVSNGELKFNDAARLVQAAWNELPKRFAKLEIDEFIVMPNHIHGILIVGGAIHCALFITTQRPRCKTGRDKSLPYIRRNRAIV